MKTAIINVKRKIRMGSALTDKMSQKGQIVIPAAIRKALGL